jgi:hypothetical protein
LKPDREYRSADTVIGVLLGAFVGAVCGIIMVIGEFQMSPLLLIGTSALSGAVLCGALAFLLGKRFTDAMETVIKIVFNYRKDQ